MADHRIVLTFLNGGRSWKGSPSNSRIDKFNNAKPNFYAGGWLIRLLFFLTNEAILYVWVSLIACSYCFVPVFCIKTDEKFTILLTAYEHEQTLCITITFTMVFFVGTWNDEKLHSAWRSSKRSVGTVEILASSASSAAEGNCNFHIWENLQNTVFDDGLPSISNPHSAFCWVAFLQGQKFHWGELEQNLKERIRGTDTWVKWYD